MKLKLALTTFALLAFATFTAHAQGGSVSSGCDTSPENPTAVLGLVGSAVGFIAALRNRARRR
jgi:XrtJ-associated TM-motif-TM protein